VYIKTLVNHGQQASGKKSSMGVVGLRGVNTILVFDGMRQPLKHRTNEERARRRIKCQIEVERLYAIRHQAKPPGQESRHQLEGTTLIPAP
jgi:hypothetical protein